MPRVVALYRHPIKGFTPESRESLTVLPSGRIAGDRVLGVRFADTAAADDAWSPKAGHAGVGEYARPGSAGRSLR